MEYHHPQGDNYRADDIHFVPWALRSKSLRSIRWSLRSKVTWNEVTMERSDRKPVLIYHCILMYDCH